MNTSTGTFELWRQDDHGQRFLVGCYPTLAQAEERLAGLSRTQHKQTYWIAASSRPRTTGDDD